ncbi:MAG TPA: peptidylprolyl isomerase [Chitinophagaceae bacterium]|nr:peptidylprolyl isomerase [Chitinophagaceae bacterium]
MNKNWALLFMTFLIVSASPAQTLFTYGNYTADAKDFLKAYNKNNTAPAVDKTKSMRDYLDLYIASRLKIREAYNRGYDTLSQIKTDIENLRSQIVENYLNDPETSEKLLKESFQRSQKDIHVAHIYISFKNESGVADTVAAGKKINEVFEKLKKGEDFSKLAQQYSSDPGAKTNNGDLGFVTVFTLPYEFENVIYSIAPGSFSAPYKSKIGYHIFKNLGERKAVGRIKAAQILLAFQPGADDAFKKKTSLLADSLYQRLLKGDDIARLAAKFSNDYVSAASGGVMPEFGIGQYDPEFEKIVFGLKKNGEISKPFVTSHGYHIVKRISLVPVVTDPNNKVNIEDLKLKVNTSDRMQYAKDLLIEKALKQIDIKKSPYSENELVILSDSLLDNKRLASPVTINRATTLFSIGDQLFTLNDFIIYAQSWRYKPDGTGAKPFNQVMDEFVHHEVETYYRTHLENFNPEFNYQMGEFKDGNLFFEIMQREVWGKAQTDTAALESYYEKNKNSYIWKQSADAVIFFCSDENSGKALYDAVKKDPSHWKAASAVFAEKVVTDSSRYEFEQIPNATKVVLQAGTITAPLKNKTDGSVSFAYVIKSYPANLPRNYTDAKGLVINDYQAELDKEWIAELKKKYPVKVDEKVFEQISK